MQVRIIVEAIVNFSLEKFDEITIETRKNGGKDGQLCVGDTFICNESMARYLLGDNPKGVKAVKVVEIRPV